MWHVRTLRRRRTASASPSFRSGRRFDMMMFCWPVLDDFQPSRGVERALGLWDSGGEPVARTRVRGLRVPVTITGPIGAKTCDHGPRSGTDRRPKLEVADELHHYPG